MIAKVGKRSVKAPEDVGCSQFPGSLTFHLILSKQRAKLGTYAAKARHLPPGYMRGWIDADFTSSLT